jgi:hypothetical protein
MVVQSKAKEGVFNNVLVRVKYSKMIWRLYGRVTGSYEAGELHNCSEWSGLKAANPLHSKLSISQSVDVRFFHL